MKKRIISLVTLIIMLAVMTVNIYADEKIGRRTYTDDWYFAEDYQGDMSVHFYSYMRPYVKYFQNNTMSRISDVTAYTRLEWTYQPKYMTNIALRIELDQAYQPKNHYSIRHIKQDIASIYIADLNNEHISRGHDGQYIYFSGEYDIETVNESEITRSGSQYYSSAGFYYWTDLSVYTYLYTNVSNGTPLTDRTWFDISCVTRSASSVISDNQPR